MSKTYLRKPITIKFIDGEEKEYHHDIFLRHEGVIVFITLSDNCVAGYYEDTGTLINQNTITTIDQLDSRYIDSYHIVPTNNILEIKCEENQEGNGNIVDYLLEYPF